MNAIAQAARSKLRSKLAAQHRVTLGQLRFDRAAAIDAEIAHVLGAYRLDGLDPALSLRDRVMDHTSEDEEELSGGQAVRLSTVKLNRQLDAD